MSFAARRLAAFSTVIILLAATGSSAIAQKKYDTGATNTEIKIGNIMPYSGPASAFGVIGRTEAAYFRKINAEGGINGRKINFISYDDAYNPPKAAEQARKLVEDDGPHWTVVDFKTGREFEANRSEYAKQVSLYATAIETATKLPTRGVLLVI